MHKLPLLIVFSIRHRIVIYATGRKAQLGICLYQIIHYRKVFHVNGDDTPPTDAPGNDCPDHGPYADEDCPKC
jgi:hypothetical protein